MTGRFLGLRQQQAPAHPFAFLLAALGLALAALLLIEVATRSAGAQTPQAEDKIGDGVREALRSDGEARVFIMLAAPPSLAAMQAAQGNMATLKSDIATLQQQVLSSLDSSDYAGVRNYQTVPALAGKILSEAALDKLAAQPAVVRIDLDVGGSGSLAGTVPLINADRFQADGITGAGVVVAVLDSGLDSDHDDLASSLIHQECFLDFDGVIDGVGRCPNGSDRQSGPGAAEDNAGHGTFTTGVIASDGNVTAPGVAPDADIVAVKVLDDTVFSGRFAFFSEIVAALDFIINERPDIQLINMSLGTNARFEGDCDNSTSFNMAGAAAINTLRARGVLAFASSGNSGSGTAMGSPACLSNVISVGATSDVDTVASFTDSNETTDLMAPGVAIVSTGLRNATRVASGTSFASPHAAGCAALLIQAGVFVTPDQLEARLESSPVRVTDPTNGLTFPRLDCNNNILDHFLFYNVRITRGTPDFEPREVTLTDQFFDRSYDVLAPKVLGNPADKNDEGIFSPETHLLGYNISLRCPEAADCPGRERVRGILVTNQFGEITLDTRAAALLMVPSAKDLDDPVLPFEDPNIDHLKCYRVRESRGSAGFEPREVFVTDQFEQPKWFQVLRPAKLCTPVDKNGEGILDAERHLLCYEVRPAEGEPPHDRLRGIHVNNQFGPLQLNTRREKELCLPSLQEVIGVF